MLYLFQVTVYSALLFAVYLIVLKDRASHNWNRVYLLLCAILPLVIPFIKIAAFSGSMPANIGSFNLQLPEIMILAKSDTVAASSYNWYDLLIAIYLLVAAIILLRTIVQYISFKNFIRHTEFKVIDNVTVLLDTKTEPGSFQNYIFLPDDKIDPVIFKHELAHIRFKHSSDILLFRFLQAAFWPNIMLYAISRELKIVHEFQADAYAVHNKQEYITTLLNDTFSTKRFTLSHTFFYHPLKRRIMMLQKSPLSRATIRTAILKTGFSAMLLIAGIIYLQSCKQQPDTLKQSTDVQKVPLSDTAVERAMIETLPKKIPVDSYDGIAHNFVDKMPTTSYDLSDYMSKNIKYPETARKKGIDGRVIVKFVVNGNGDVQNAVVVRGVDPELDAEAIRVISSMPQWVPGEKDGKKVSVYYTLPISYSLGNK